MASFLLTTNSLITCPHAGSVAIVALHGVAATGGGLVVFMDDPSLVAGCPWMIGDRPSPCVKVLWMTGSSTLFDRGTPALIHTSVGLCVGADGGQQGSAIILTSSFQLDE